MSPASRQRSSSALKFPFDPLYCSHCIIISVTLKYNGLMTIQFNFSPTNTWSRSRCLERLSLDNYYGDAKWRLPIITSQLTQLRALHLSSFEVSDDLIVHLSDQGRAVPCTTARTRHPGKVWLRSKPEVGLPQTKAGSWARLHTYSPCLQVHVRVMDRIPHDELFGFLLPEMKVASIIFTRYSKCRNVRSIVDVQFNTPQVRRLIALLTRARCRTRLCGDEM